MSKAKWCCGKKPSTGVIIAVSANQIVPPYKTCLLYSPNPPFLFGGRSGLRLTCDEITFSPGSRYGPSNQGHHGPSSILVIIMHVCPHDHLATDSDVNLASVVYTVRQYGFVLALCYPCEVCVSSALPYIHMTIC